MGQAFREEKENCTNRERVSTAGKVWFHVFAYVSEPAHKSDAPHDRFTHL